MGHSRPTCSWPLMATYTLYTIQDFNKLRHCGILKDPWLSLQRPDHHPDTKRARRVQRPAHHPDKSTLRKPNAWSPSGHLWCPGKFLDRIRCFCANSVPNPAIRTPKSPKKVIADHPSRHQRPQNGQNGHQTLNFGKFWSGLCRDNQGSSFLRKPKTHYCALIYYTFGGSLRRRFWYGGVNVADNRNRLHVILRYAIMISVSKSLNSNLFTGVTFSHLDFYTGVWAVSYFCLLVRTSHSSGKRTVSKSGSC